MVFITKDLRKVCNVKERFRKLSVKAVLPFLQEILSWNNASSLIPLEIAVQSNLLLKDLPIGTPYGTTVAENISEGSKGLLLALISARDNSAITLPEYIFGNQLLRRVLLLGSETNCITLYLMNNDFSTVGSPPQVVEVNNQGRVVTLVC